MAITVPQIQRARVQEAGLELTSSQVNAPIEAFGGGRGVARVEQAVSSLGKNISNAVFNIVEREREKADRAAVKGANLDLANRFVDLQKRLDESKGEEAINFENVGLEELDKFREEKMKSLTSDNQRDLFDRNFQERRISFRSSAARKSVLEADRLDKARTQSLIETEVESAVQNKTNPDRISDSLGRAQAAFIERAKEDGLDKNSIQIGLQKISSETHSKIINSFLSERVNAPGLVDDEGNSMLMAEKYFRDNKDDMTTDQQTVSLNAIERMKTRINNEEKKIKKLAIKEPYAFLHFKGFAEGRFQPLDFSSDNVGNSFESRRQYRLAAELQYPELKGRIPLVSPDEAKGFAALIEKSTPEERAGILQVINTKLPDDLENEFGAQVFKENPVSGVALSVAGDDPATANRILQGRDKFLDKAVPKASPTEVQRQVLDYLKDSIDDSEFLKNIGDSAYAHYLQVQFEKGEDTSVLGGDFEESIEKVVGKSFKINGKQILGFRNSAGEQIDDDDFEDLVDEIDSENILAVHGEIPMIATEAGIEPLDINKAKSRLKFKSVGDGVYFVGLGGKYAIGNDGRPFKLKLKEMEEKLSSGEIKKAKKLSMSVGSFKGLKI